MTTMSAIASGMVSAPRTARTVVVPARSTRASWLAMLNSNCPGICMSSSLTVALCCAARMAPTWLRAGSARRAERRACWVRANSTILSVSALLTSAAARSAVRLTRPAAQNAPSSTGTPARAARAQRAGDRQQGEPERNSSSARMLSPTSRSRSHRPPT
nr:hypothetical protein [Acrocarpospora catenulata]